MMSMQAEMDHFRDTGPYPVVCQRCENRFGYAAPHPFLDELLLGVVLVPKTEKSGGYRDIVGYQTPGTQPIGGTVGYPPDSAEWEQQSQRRIIASGDGRFTFNCDKCGNRPVLKMETLKHLYSEAHTNPDDHTLRV